jgi:hypothetical protein
MTQKTAIQQHHSQPSSSSVSSQQWQCKGAVNPDTLLTYLDVTEPSGLNKAKDLAKLGSSMKM